MDKYLYNQMRSFYLQSGIIDQKVGIYLTLQETVILVKPRGFLFLPAVYSPLLLHVIFFTSNDQL